MFENKIKFICCDSAFENIWPHPRPANYFLPEEYKNLKRHTDGNLHKATVKTCMPFLDAMTFGYIIPLDQDYVVDATETDLSISIANKTNLEPAGFHPANQLPPGLSKGKEHAGKFHNKWIIKTPPGYSCLFVQPLNRVEDRFEIISGVVDTDSYINLINFPFHWKKWNKQTLLKKGEPMVQVIPFKREKWKKWSGFVFEKEHGHTIRLLESKFIDKYKSFFWKKKSFK
jgi:hypothetical protein